MEEIGPGYRVTRARKGFMYTEVSAYILLNLRLVSLAKFADDMCLARLAI